MYKEMDDSLPYRVAYAAEKTKCQNCRHSIKKDALQIAIMIQSNADDCQYPTWYHLQCFFKTRIPSTEAAFDGFAQLRYEHQLAIKKYLGIGAIEIDQDMGKVRDFAISYATTTRDSCIACQRRFNQDELRIMQVVCTTIQDENQNDVKKSANWYHVACFVGQRAKIGWLRSGDSLPGFKRLSANDKEMIQIQIPDMIVDTVELENKIQIQNEGYFKVYDYIAKNVPKEDQIRILNENRQAIPDTEAQVLHHLTDVIYFGALRTCNSCKKGRPLFSNWIYKCTHKSAWTTCGNEEKVPRGRKLSKIPAELLAEHSFLDQQRDVRIRALHSFKFVDDQGNDLVYAPYKKPLLFNMKFVLIGTFKKPQGDIEQLIKKLGGKVRTEINDRVAAIISTVEEVRKMDKPMMDARNHKIQVVSEDFLDDIQTPGVDPIFYIISKTICNWGGDPYARIEENDVVTQRNASFYTKSLPEKITLKWKDGTAVDPECGLDENAHVYSAVENGKRIHYSVILGLVDIGRNKNSFYRMQLLESNDQNLYWVFESWGRIGTVVGSKQLKNYGKLHEALDRFNSVYKDKTDNNFGYMKFQKRPDKFYRLDVEIGMPKKVPDTFIATKLDAPVFDLMQMLFDIKNLENIMCGCDLDPKQMPLGKISTKQIKSAMSTLLNIAEMIQRNASVHELRDASNKFYTLIPHAFGVKDVPIIDSVEAVGAKNELLESLLNMEIIYNFLEEQNGEKIHPLDACYRKLKATIVPIAQDTVEFRQLCNIVRHTSYGYRLKVLEIFKVARDGEDDRFQQQLGDHRLLMHGSRLMNFASILSNGLKIAPPEAPSSGYRFGKGIYFADAVGKSAGYCYPDHNIGLMLMCEVALGQTKELTDAFNVMDIPNAKYQSVQFLGGYDPKEYRYIDGVSAPFGRLFKSKEQNGSEYNEFIVYNPNQVKIKYLFKLQFNYK